MEMWDHPPGVPLLHSGLMPDEFREVLREPKGIIFLSHRAGKQTCWHI